MQMSLALWLLTPTSSEPQPMATASACGSGPARRRTPLLKLEALRRCVNTCGLRAAFWSWASAGAALQPPLFEEQPSGQLPQARHTHLPRSRKTLRLLEALRLIVLHEPLGRAHVALRHWHELANGGGSSRSRSALRDWNERAAPPKSRATPTTLRPRHQPPLRSEADGGELVSVTAADLHTLMASVEELQEQLVRRRPCPSTRRVAIWPPLWPHHITPEASGARVASREGRACPV